MRVAIISDIHSNVHALNAVLKDVQLHGVDQLIILGDLFGYYPWALETYQTIIEWEAIGCIKGNHDIILEKEISANTDSPLYIELAQLNRNQLLHHAPQAIEWLKTLKCLDQIQLEQHLITLCHGTPENPVDGRFYPDNNEVYDWFPSNNELLLLGHTHYPLLKEVNNGIIFNPGSVGQPRDGIVDSSYGIIDLEKKEFSHHRVAYDIESVSNLLIEMNWHPYAIKALNKNYKGTLKD